MSHLPGNARAMADRNRRYLLIARVGGQSLHAEWLAPRAARGFDVLLSSYDRAVADPQQPGVTLEFRPGSKVAGYAALLAAHADLIAGYDYVALFDDDLSIDAAELTRMFEIADAYHLKIAQPALSHDSHFTYAALLANSAFRLRYVNYIEMMCPVFRSDILAAVRPLYAMGYESGIDLIWCNLVATTDRDFAVIDDVVVRHTRTVGTSKAANGFTGGKRYEDDIHAILARFGLPWLSCVPFAGVRRDGTVTHSRWAFGLNALRLAAVVPKATGAKLRARSVAVYWKHLVFRKPRNIPVTFPAEKGTASHGV
ncbi:MAG: DUF707 domain-containing protein [Sphingomonadaceae bacterium]